MIIEKMKMPDKDNDEMPGPYNPYMQRAEPVSCAITNASITKFCIMQNCARQFKNEISYQQNTKIVNVMATTMVTAMTTWDAHKRSLE